MDSGTAAPAGAAVIPGLGKPARHPTVALLLMSVSGFAALGYQIVWTRQASLWLGQDHAAVLAVVAAFFGGLALGAWALGSRIERSAQPAAWYAGCEAAIGAWGLVLAFAIAPMSHQLLDLMGQQPGALRQWGVAFIGTFVVLLPATAAMGATLPALERMLARLQLGTWTIAGLYGANTAGAVLGVLAAAFWLLPLLGLTLTSLVCVALNLVCATVAWRTFPVQESAGLKWRPSGPAPSGGTLWLLSLTGLLGIGYEVLAVRVLSQVNENTIYTFALLLAVYLVGTAIGAAAYAALRARSSPRAEVANSSEALTGHLLQALACSCVLGTLSMSQSASVKRWILESLGPGWVVSLAAEAALATLAFGLPTFVMGALFSHLATRARDAGVGLGTVLGVNTLGAATAPALFGVVLLPAAGASIALVAIVVSYVVLSLRGVRQRPTAGFLLAALASVALLLWLPNLRFVDLPPGSRVLSYVDGSSASVSILEHADGSATLHINNRQAEGSSATLSADARQALLPMLLHPEPKRALFLGVGTGITASAAAAERGVQVDAVELLPEVLAASTHFRSDFNHAYPTAVPRLLVADARRFVRTATADYDVIVADNFHPARSGSGSLYTVEHFTAVRSRLTTQGLFVQWLPLHQMDLETLRSIVRSFRGAFPQATAVLATLSLETPVIGLVGRAENARFDPAAWRDRLRAIDTPLRPEHFGITDDLALGGSFIADTKALARFSDRAPLNRDDLPWVTYRAPWITYAPDSRPRERLIAVLRSLDVKPHELPLNNAKEGWVTRLSAYMAARDRFLVAGVSVKPTSDVRAMLAQVQEPLLEVLRISPEFLPAYVPLVRMAEALGEVDPAAAAQLRATLAALRADHAPLR